MGHASQLHHVSATFGLNPARRDPSEQERSFDLGTRVFSVQCSVRGFEGLTLPKAVLTPEH